MADEGDRFSNVPDFTFRKIGLVCVDQRYGVFSGYVARQYDREFIPGDSLPEVNAFDVAMAGSRALRR